MYRNLFMIMLLFCLLLIGCDDTTLKSQNDEPMPIYPSESLTQPILFDNIGDVIKFLSSKDLKDYFEEDQKIYSESIDILLANGHLIVPKCASAKQVYKITFYPKVNNEDAGIGFWYEYDKELYQVNLYDFDKSIISKDNEIDIIEYKREKFGIEINNENVIEHKINGISSNLMISKFGLENNMKNIISFIPLENKYIEIKSSTSIENIVCFIESLDYEYINLN